MLQAAFYSTARAFATKTIGISRDPIWHLVDNNKPHLTDIPTFQVWGSNLSFARQEVEIRLRMYDIDHRREVDLGAAAKATYTLEANKTTEFATIKCPPAVEETSYIILSASLHHAETGAEIARKVSWPEPYRYLDLPGDTHVSVKVTGEEVELECGKYPVKGVLAYVDDESGEEPSWEDNFWDMMPGEKVTVQAPGLDGRAVHVRHLANLQRQFKVTTGL
jgi:beta-mannosidase